MLSSSAGRCPSSSTAAASPCAARSAKDRSGAGAATLADALALALDPVTLVPLGDDALLSLARQVNDPERVAGTGEVDRSAVAPTGHAVVYRDGGGIFAARN